MNGRYTAKQASKQSSTALSAEREKTRADGIHRVPALFIFQLQTDDVLSHRATLGLRGNALDITILGVAGEALLVSVDAVGNAGDISVFERDGVLWAPRASIQGIADRDEQCLISREELDKALYTVETLRKTDNDEREDGDGDGDVPETSEKR